MADSDVGVLDRKTFNLIAAVVRAEMGAVKNRLVSETVDSAPPSVQPRWVPFVNTTSETIPAYAIMAISTGSDFDADAGQSLLKVSKPSTTFCRMYAVNSSVDSTALGGGVCYLSGPVQVLYDASSSPAVGDGYGPKSGSWAVFKGYPQTTTILGTVNTTTGIAHATLNGQISTLVGKTDASIAAISTNTPGSGTVSIYALVSSTLTDTNQNVTAYNMTATAVSSGVYVQLKYIDGVPWVDVESCP